MSGPNKPVKDEDRILDAAKNYHVALKEIPPPPKPHSPHKSNVRPGSQPQHPHATPTQDIGVPTKPGSPPRTPRPATGSPPRRFPKASPTKATMVSTSNAPTREKTMQEFKSPEVPKKVPPVPPQQPNKPRAVTKPIVVQPKSPVKEAPKSQSPQPLRAESKKVFTQNPRSEPKALATATTKPDIKQSTRQPGLSSGPKQPPGEVNEQAESTVKGLWKSITSFLPTPSHRHKQAGPREKSSSPGPGTSKATGATKPSLATASAKTPLKSPKSEPDKSSTRRVNKPIDTAVAEKQALAEVDSWIERTYDTESGKVYDTDAESRRSHQPSMPQALPHVVVNPANSTYFGSIMQYVKLVFKGGHLTGEDSAEEKDERAALVIGGKRKKRKRRFRKNLDNKTRSSILFSQNRKLRKTKLKRLMHVLETMEDHLPQESEMIPDLSRFGIPPQTPLLDSLLNLDYRRYDFGHKVQLMFSPVLRSWVPINTANTYVAASKYLPAFSSLVYHGIDDHTDQFAEDERKKAETKHKELEELKAVAKDDQHFQYLKELVVRQSSSLPLSVMFDLLHEQTKVVKKYSNAVHSALGKQNKHTKVASTQLGRMEAQLETLAKIGLTPLPPLAILRKYQQPPREENWDITPTSSSDSEKELDSVLQHKIQLSQEEKKLIEVVDADNAVLGIIKNSRSKINLLKEENQAGPKDQRNRHSQRSRKSE